MQDKTEREGGWGVTVCASASHDPEQPASQDAEVGLDDTALFLSHGWATGCDTTLLRERPQLLSRGSGPVQTAQALHFTTRATP